MANATQSVIGALNKAVSNTAGSQAYDTKYATYLKLFSGELFKAYESATIARDTVQRRTLKNGKSLQFIFTGRMQAAYHTPGEPILGSGDPPVAEKTIQCDDLLISSAFVYDLDETLAHYSLRSEISAKIGHALAEAYDKKVFRTIAKAAREASFPTYTGTENSASINSNIENPSQSGRFGGFTNRPFLLSTLGADTPKPCGIQSKLLFISLLMICEICSNKSKGSE